jgi:hypothetical protein
VDLRPGGGERLMLFCVDVRECLEAGTCQTLISYEVLAGLSWCTALLGLVRIYDAVLDGRGRYMR